MAGAEDQPVLTVKRISELRTKLAEAFRSLRKSYAEAQESRGDSEARARANAWRDRLCKIAREALTEYENCCIPTQSEEYAANELLSEIKVFRDALEEEYLPLTLREDGVQTSPIPQDPEAPANTGRLLPSEPRGEEGGRGDEEMVRGEDPNRTQRMLNLSEKTKSKASSLTGKGAGRSNTGSKGSCLSNRSSKATIERDEDLAREESRREQEKTNNELEMENLMRKIKEIARRDELDARLSCIKKDAINRLHDEQQRVIEEEEEGEEEKESDRPELMFTVGGLDLGEEAAGERTRAWAEQVRMSRDGVPKTSTVKKDVVKKVNLGDLRETFVIPEISEKGTSPAASKSSKKRGRCEKKERKAQVGEKREKEKELSKEQRRLMAEMERLEGLLNEKKKEVQESFRSTERKEKRRVEQSAAKQASGFGSDAIVQTGMEKFMDMQARMWAITHLQEIRPKAKFSGGRKTDFAKQMRLVEGAFETPAISARQKLQELQHYFDGPAYDLVETDVLREDAETALSDAMGKLNRKFGVRRETALEMLEDLLGGKQVGERDHGALLMFYAKLQSVHSLAMETGRAADFETKSVVETILRKKLPHLMNKWFKKSVRHIREKGEELAFADFLKFVDEEHAVMEMLARAMQGSQTGQKVGQTAKVAATNVGKERPHPAPTKGGGKECSVCGAAHAVAACPAFKSMSAADKRRQCQAAGLCFRCLERGHAARFCPEEGRCNVCNQTHHPLLHALFSPQPGAASGEMRPEGSA